LPFTPYHFGLVFRKWVDLPVFVLANVVIDVEVLIIIFFGLGQPVHRYAHTLLGGLVLGVVWAVAAYPMRGLFKKAMAFLRLKYETCLLKMIISGVLGVWLHVLIDGIYHADVKPFWPNKTSLWLRIVRRIGYNKIDDLKSYVETGCVIFWLAGIAVYLLVLWRQWRRKRIAAKE